MTCSSLELREIKVLWLLYIAYIGAGVDGSDGWVLMRGTVFIFVVGGVRYCVALGGN
jgi:hypothetical protein